MVPGLGYISYNWLLANLRKHVIPQVIIIMPKQSIPSLPLQTKYSFHKIKSSTLSILINPSPRKTMILEADWVPPYPLTHRYSLVIVQVQPTGKHRKKDRFTKCTSQYAVFIPSMCLPPDALMPILWDSILQCSFKSGPLSQSEREDLKVIWLLSKCSWGNLHLLP